jgi:diguanylate cyclase (GGDEF)-like protein
MELFLTPASISFLAQTIVFLVITIYLVAIKTRTVVNYWLAGFYIVMVTASLAGFFGVSVLSWYENALYTHDVLIVASLPLLIQFAYNFPVMNPKRKRQSRIVLIFSIIIILLAIISLIVKLLITNGITLPDFAPIILSVIQLVGLLIVIVIFFDVAKNNMIESKNVNLIRILIKPDNRISKAARSFIINLFCLFIIWAVSLVLQYLNNFSVAFFVTTLGTVWALTILMITLLNQTKQKESFYFKFFGIVLVTIFTGICASSWLAAPTNLANYQASYAIPNRQTIHFEQNNATFAITQKDSNFIENIGNKIQFSDGQTSASVDLQVSFPFAGENWNQIIVSQKGYILFNHTDQNFDKLSLPNNPTPLIAALYLEDLIPSSNSGVFINSTEEKSIITWYLLPKNDYLEERITTQITLFPDGSFDINYNGVRANFIYNPYYPIELHHVTGYFLGKNDRSPSRVQFNAKLPIVSENWSGVYQDYYIDFRANLNQNILMQLFSMVLILLFIVIIFPIFLHNSLIMPLRTLRHGIFQVMNDDFQTQLEPRFNDEFGQTTYEFNQMLTKLSDQKNLMDEKILELEDRLTQRTTELKVSVDKLTVEIGLRKNIKAKLEKSIKEIKKLAIMDDLVNCYNRDHFIFICEEELKRAKRYELPLSLVLIDPDYLRMINETYGNITGNEVLKLMVENIRSKLRETDMLGRIGGEEFAIIMPQTSGVEALLGANRIRNIIGNNSFETSKGSIRISASLGVVEMPREGILSLDVLLNRASLARDYAKNLGRNQAVLYTPNMEKN